VEEKVIFGPGLLSDTGEEGGEGEEDDEDGGRLKLKVGILRGEGLEEMVVWERLAVRSLMEEVVELSLS
jgi:hypothetical protein